MALRAGDSPLLRNRTAALLVTISLLASARLPATDKPITVALVFDGLSPKEREPLQAYLTRAMGRPVRLAVPDLYSETVAHLADGSYDFACLGGLPYIRAHAKYGVIPLVRRSTDLNFHSVVITGTHSSIYSLLDLKGKRFAFGDVNATSSLMFYRELLEVGINPETDFKFQYSGSHVATAALVESGVVDAGVLDETIFAALVRAGKLNSKKVRVFHTSMPFVSYVYVSRADVPQADRERFTRALIDLKEGKNDAVLKILRARQFVLAKDQEYETIRQAANKLKRF
jgi:phosphonate transport system substrate-binding protein